MAMCRRALFLVTFGALACSVITGAVRAAPFELKKAIPLIIVQFAYSELSAWIASFTLVLLLPVTPILFEKAYEKLYRFLADRVRTISKGVTGTFQPPRYVRLLCALPVVPTSAIVLFGASFLSKSAAWSFEPVHSLGVFQGVPVLAAFYDVHHWAFLFGIVALVVYAVTLPRYSTARRSIVEMVRRAVVGHCSECGYDLTGTGPSGHCPECGQAMGAGSV